MLEKITMKRQGAASIRRRHIKERKKKNIIAEKKAINAFMQPSSQPFIQPTKQSGMHALND